ncbi:MAG: M48 family metallopeptidase [Burkholderiaceae bacterium]|nr:M48 family metallopeptidase [Burkholderiaceae bacterium]
MVSTMVCAHSILRDGAGQPSRVVPRLAIHVERDGCVLVDAPDAIPLANVLIAVKKRSRRIRLHVIAAKVRLAHALPREYVSGEPVHYLGRRYRLKVIVNTGVTVQTRMRGMFIAVTAPERSTVSS